jgi:hypothetical protein
MNMTRKRRRRKHGQKELEREGRTIGSNVLRKIMSGGRKN